MEKYQKKGPNLIRRRPEVVFFLARALENLCEGKDEIKTRKLATHLLPCRQERWFIWLTRSLKKTNLDAAIRILV